MGATPSTAVRTAQFLADHDGVITTAQARELGLTDDQIRYKTSEGLWIPHARSVFLSAEHHMTPIGSLRVATAAHHGVVDRTSAAWLHGLTRDVSSPVTLSVPRSGHGSAYCAVETTVRRRSFPAEDLTRVRGVPTTGLALTVLAASSAMKDGIAMMDRALQKKVVTLGELRAALNRNSGAYGMAQAREILTSAEDLSESELERKFVRFLQRRRISGWKQQEWVGDRRMDFVWPAEQVAVSLHGWAFHRSHDRWERDQETTNMLIGLRWLPLIFTWKRLTYSPDDVFRELTTAIDQRQIAA